LNKITPSGRGIIYAEVLGTGFLGGTYISS